MTKSSMTSGYLHLDCFSFPVCVLALALAGALLIAGCEGITGSDGETRKQAEPIDRQELPRDLSTPEMAVSDGAGEMGFDLMQAIWREQSDENHLIPPLSIMMAFGMVLHGADGATYDQTQDALGLEGLAQDEINEGARGLMDLLSETGDGVDLQIANALWHDTDRPFSPQEDFISSIQRRLRSG